MTELETEPSSCLNCGGDRADLPRPTPCRYCGATYAACVDGEACCKACLHIDGHAALAAGRKTTAEVLASLVARDVERHNPCGHVAVSDNWQETCLLPKPCPKHQDGGAL